MAGREGEGGGLGVLNALDPDRAVWRDPGGHQALGILPHNF